MEAVLLAAGPGTRLRPLTHERPKNMLAVAGKPLLHHLLQSLKAAGVHKVILVVGHGHEHVRRYVGDGDRFDLEVDYVDQPERLGLGHALQCARDHVKDDEFLLLAADAWYHPKVIARFTEAKGPAMLVVQDGTSFRFGVPRIDGGKATGLRLVDRPVDATPAGGAYRLPKRIFDSLSPQDVRLVEVLDRDMQQHGPWGRIQAQDHEYVDIREPEDLLLVHDRLMSHTIDATPAEAPEGVHLEGDVQIGEGTTLRPGTVVMGPAVIGNHCDIGPHAVIGPGTTVRHQARIGPFTFMERCSIASNVTIGAQCRVHNAIVDEGARLHNGSRVDGGAAIVGADAVLEDEAHVLPGGRIGVGARITAGRSVKDVPDHGVAV